MSKTGSVQIASLEILKRDAYALVKNKQYFFHGRGQYDGAKKVLRFLKRQKTKFTSKLIVQSSTALLTGGGSLIVANGAAVVESLVKKSAKYYSWRKNKVLMDQFFNKQQNLTEELSFETLYQEYAEEIGTYLHQQGLNDLMNCTFDMYLNFDEYKKNDFTNSSLSTPCDTFFKEYEHIFRCEQDIQLVGEKVQLPLQFGSMVSKLLVSLISNDTYHINRQLVLSAILDSNKGEALTYLNKVANSRTVFHARIYDGDLRDWVKGHNPELDPESTHHLNFNIQPSNYNNAADIGKAKYVKGVAMSVAPKVGSVIYDSYKKVPIHWGDTLSFGGISLLTSLVLNGLDVRSQMNQINALTENWSKGPGKANLNDNEKEQALKDFTEVNGNIANIESLRRNAKDIILSLTKKIKELLDEGVEWTKPKNTHEIVSNADGEILKLFRFQKHMDQVKVMLPALEILNTLCFTKVSIISKIINAQLDKTDHNAKACVAVSHDCEPKNGPCDVSKYYTCYCSAMDYAKQEEQYWFSSHYNNISKNYNIKHDTPMAGITPTGALYGYRVALERSSSSTT
jgi:hypothetical protein